MKFKDLKVGDIFVWGFEPTNISNAAKMMKISELSYELQMLDGNNVVITPKKLITEKRVSRIHKSTIRTE